MKQGTTFVLEVNPKIPRKLLRLKELANNLWYGWDKPTRTLFARLHPGLWDAVGHNPNVFLRRVDEKRLVDAAEDQVFLATLNRVLSAYDTYHNEPLRRIGGHEQFKEGELVAYFCAEFGFHESFPIYSGGLGILAGDHCKSASDLRLPFVAVGLLYRQGYFSQMIDGEGNQIATYSDSDFGDLPIAPALGADGKDLHVAIDMPGRQVMVQVWQARVGHITLYLLDTDIEENSPDDRDIAHQLYGGDSNIRIKQEIILGVGGVRALKALGLKPTVWHINEGHAAFMVLERARYLVAEGLDFASALEAAASNTVFTTHTPVPAGHDHFAENMVCDYFQQMCHELKISRETFIGLGRTSDGPDFNMTALALHGSRYHNGVSRIHGGVSSRICANHWPQVLPEENPMSYVTNGVHVPTFMAQEWIDLFDNQFGYEWRHRLTDVGYWSRINEIPDHVFWSVRQSLKSQMLELVRFRISQQHFRNHGSEAHLDRLLKHVDYLNPNVLTIGFARRFATYKRAALLFEDPAWLSQIISEADRPVLFIFAGKAHPADHPGQDLIRQIHHISHMPEFEGKVLVVEGYDMGLARRLVAGVDVWLNNPVYPLEASGTSGMKAGINGAINLSVLDGWWGEGYDGTNGWAIKPAPAYMDDYRSNKEDSQTLYEILQDQVVPQYYDRGKLGYSAEWIRRSKASIATLLPRFNSSRMAGEYASRFYLPASRQGELYAQNDYENAKDISAWKDRVRGAWHSVEIRRLDTPKKHIQFGDTVRFEVALKLNGLAPDDVVVEMTQRPARKDMKDFLHFRFTFQSEIAATGEHLFALDLSPELCGRLDYKIRVYPWRELLTHPLEMGLMVWL
ncbi:MAG: alpha-glucan family phosphorylase [Betaproteobacteria bacterium]|nr:alpha-glucan family phosphorylase [Betaproteobacteria bacterium]